MAKHPPLLNAVDFEYLFRALPSPHMVVDRGLTFVAVNAAYERVTKRSRAELIGGKLFELFPNDGQSGDLLRESLARVLRTGESDTIAYIPYEIPRPESEGGGFDLRYWTAIHTPLMDAEGEVAYVLQNTADVTDIVALQAAATLPFRPRSGAVELLQRAQEAEVAYRASLSDSADFQRMFQSSPSLIAVMRGPDHIFTFANEAYQRYVGDRPLIGLSIRDVFPEIGEQGFFDILQGVFGGGGPHLAEGQRILLRQMGQERLQEVFLDFSFHPIHDMTGAVTGIFFQGMDRTEHFRSLHRQRLMVDELNHRVKNTLSTVQSIARQSFRGTETEASRQAFEARIIALSRAHDVLSERLWHTVALSALLNQELAAFDTSRVRLAGPDVDLNPKAAIALAMVFHELATNAARFGALSGETGGLQVDWQGT
ncbi:MAG: PAS domain-containing protein, partial [Caulobacteraceae bacterium]